MTKHLGSIIAFIALAGIALYIVRHYADFLAGSAILRQLLNGLL